MAAGFGRGEIIVVSFAAAVNERLALVVLLVVVIPLVSSSARSFLLRLLAGICFGNDLFETPFSVSTRILTYAAILDAEAHALLPGLKPVVVAETAAIDVLDAVFEVLVVVPLEVIALARPSHFRQVASI